MSTMPGRFCGVLYDVYIAVGPSCHISVCAQMVCGTGGCKRNSSGGGSGGRRWQVAAADKQDRT